MDVTNSVNTTDKNGRTANGLWVKALQRTDTALKYLLQTSLWVHPRRKQRDQGLIEWVNGGDPLSLQYLGKLDNATSRLLFDDRNHDHSSALSTSLLFPSDSNLVIITSFLVNSKLLLWSNLWGGASLYGTQLYGVGPFMKPLCTEGGCVETQVWRGLSMLYWGL